MQKTNGQWQCRVAPSLGDGFEGTPNEVWGTRDYADNFIDNEKPAVFFGLYGLPDFYALWRHKGKRAILWAGSDIRHFVNGYWLDATGNIRICYNGFAEWIDKYCENWVENDVEREMLSSIGIQAFVCPSFLGNIEKYELSYKHSTRPKIYSSVSGDDFDLYGWDKIIELALKNSDIEFHLYGNTREYKIALSNVFVHGRVPKEQMNAEIKEMQGALRLIPMEGFSEIIAKSVLWGQWPISVINYPFMLATKDIGKLKELKEPNNEGRKYYKEILNTYPWNQK